MMTVTRFVAQLRPALSALIVLTLVTGCVFPLALLGLGRGLFPDQASGSLARLHGGVIGSRLIGQAFARPMYFQPRPSAAGAGYDGAQSGGSNLAPANPRLAEAIRRAAADFRSRNHLAPGADVPIDAVTNSGSGLDPEISPENAALQAPRVAASRGAPEALVRRLVAERTRGRQLGFIGAPRVSVLELNLALDRLAPAPSRYAPPHAK
jgi:K+-transporting ATPase ATPase C chain